MEQIGLLIPRHWKSILSRRNSSGQKTGREALHNFTAPFLFPQGVDETHIQHIFNETIHTKIVITTARALKLDLQYLGMRFSYTFSSNVLQAMKQPSLLQHLPGQFIYATMVLSARLEGRKRKQGVLSVLLPKQKNASFTLIKCPQVMGSSPTWIIIIPNSAIRANKQEHTRVSLMVSLFLRSKRFGILVLHHPSWQSAQQNCYHYTTCLALSAAKRGRDEILDFQGMFLLGSRKAVFYIEHIQHSTIITFSCLFSVSD